MKTDMTCPRATDDNMACYLRDGQVSAMLRSNSELSECIGCKMAVPDIHEEASRRAGPDVRKFSALLSILQITGKEEVNLEGVNIAHLTRGVDIACRPGELMDVRLHLLLNSEQALEIPETMANISVIDIERSIQLEMALAELVSLLKVDTEDLDPITVESLGRADRLLGEERLDSRPDTVGERLKKAR